MNNNVNDIAHKLDEEIEVLATERRHRLNAVVKERHLTLQEIEKLTGVGKSIVQRYLSGETKKIPIDFFEKMARITNVPVEYLTCFDKEKTAPIETNRDGLTEVLKKLSKDNEELVKDYADLLLLKQQSQSEQGDQ